MPNIKIPFVGFCLLNITQMRKNSLSFPLSELHANDEGSGENRMTSIRTIEMPISHFYLTGNLKNDILIF